MTKIFLTFFLISLTLSINAQGTVQVSLEELKEDLVNNNLDLRLSDQQIALTKEDLRLSSKNMTPTVNLSGTLSSTNVPLHAFGTRLQQSRIMQEDFNPILLNNPAHIQNFQASINVMQPILNLDSYNYKKASQHAVNATISGHSRNKEHFLYMLEGAYLQLQYLYRIKGELENIRNRAQRTVEIAEDALDVGYAYQDDLLKAQVRLNEVDDKILEISLNTQTISDNINYLSGRDLNVILEPSFPMDTTINASPNPSLNPNRSDFQALEYGIEASKEITRAHNNSRKPRINAILSYEANLYDVVDGGNGYWAGLQMSWQLFDGSKTSARAQKSRINQMQSSLSLEKSKKEGVKQLNQLVNQEALIRAKIQTAKEAIAQTEETFRISVNRFKEGIEKASDMILKEINLSENIIELQRLYLEYQQNLKAITFTAG